MKKPYMKFYGRDWLGDPALRMVTPAARGVWIDLLCAMSMAVPYGHLTVNGAPMTDEQAARVCGITLAEYAPILATIESAGISSRTPDGTLYSRRLVRDHQAYAVFADAGRKGGNPALTPLASPNTVVDINTKPEAIRGLTPPLKPTLKGAIKRFAKPTAAEVTAYGKEIGFEIDGQYFVDHYDSVGWMRGKTAMKDWRGTVRTWKRNHSSGYGKQIVKTHANTFIAPGQSEHEGAF